MTALERQSIMNDLGKTIAKHRKEHGLNQSQLAKELIDYNVHVKQNTVSALGIRYHTAQCQTVARYL